MSKTCGDIGGTTKSGKPCGIVTHGQLCGLHAEGADRRTSLLTNDQIAEVERMAELACTHDEISHILGVSPATFRNRMDDQGGVRGAYEKGRAKGHEEVKGALRKQIRDGNVTAMIFYLKTQCGWKDTQTIEHTGPHGGAIQLVEIHTPVLTADGSKNGKPHAAVERMRSG